MSKKPIVTFTLNPALDLTKCYRLGIFNRFAEGVSHPKTSVLSCL